MNNGHLLSPAQRLPQRQLHRSWETLRKKLQYWSDCLQDWMQDWTHRNAVSFR